MLHTLFWLKKIKLSTQYLGVFSTKQRIFFNNQTAHSNHILIPEDFSKLKEIVPNDILMFQVQMGKHLAWQHIWSAILSSTLS